MKKIFVFVLILFTVSCLFASQQLFTQDCEEVQVLYRLFREGGAVIPSYVFPVTGDVLLQTVEYSGIEEKLEPESLSVLYNLESKFSGEDVLYRLSDDFAFNADVSLAATLWYPSADKDWAYSSGYEPLFRNNRIPAFLKAEADLFMTDYAVGHFEYEYSKNFEEYDDDGFQTNLPFGSDRNSTVPYNTYLNIGMKKLNVFAGRVRNSSGNGITGNLGVGDDFLFRNTVKMQLNALPFSYEIVVNRFDSEKLDAEYNKCGETEPSNLTHISRLDTEAPLVVMHKANFIFGKKLNIGLYEAMMDYSKATLADPKLLGPFNLMHNFLSYRYDSNNFFGADFDWAALKGLNIHGELMFDQIQLSDEKDKKVPGAFGALINGRYTRKIESSYFTFYSEFVYTNPWLYLKPAGDYFSTDTNYYTLDLITGNFHMRDVQTDISYLGYKYGPNTVVGNLGAVWEKNKNTLMLDVLVKMNGDTGLKRYTDKTATGDDKFVNAVSPFILKDGNKTQELYQFSVADRYDFFGNGMLKLSAGLTMQIYRNLNCVKNNNHTNFIFAFGAVFHPVKMLKK